MIQLSETTTISRSPSEIFAFVADMNNFPKWRNNLVSFNVLTAGPTDVGTRCTEVVQVSPMRVSGSCDVTEFSPGRMMAFKATSPGSSGSSTMAGFSLSPGKRGQNLPSRGTCNQRASRN